MNVSEWITIAIGGPGAVSMILLIWERVKRRTNREAITGRDLDDLRHKVTAASDLAATVAHENIACAQQRSEDSRRIGTLEGGSEKVAGKLDQLREEFVVYRASNDEAHKSVTATLGHQTRAIEQLQAQIRNLASDSHSRVIEMPRRGKGEIL